MHWPEALRSLARRVRDDAHDVLRLSYAISAILPQNARSRRVAERSGGRAAGHMDVWDLTWDRYVRPLATGDLRFRQNGGHQHEHNQRLRRARRRR
jgi:RimJ/RimL family protein N-acetyltransferase